MMAARCDCECCNNKTNIRIDNNIRHILPKNIKGKNLEEMLRLLYCFNKETEEEIMDFIEENPDLLTYLIDAKEVICKTYGCIPIYLKMENYGDEEKERLVIVLCTHSSDLAKDNTAPNHFEEWWLENITLNPVISDRLEFEYAQ